MNAVGRGRGAKHAKLSRGTGRGRIDNIDEVTSNFRLNGRQMPQLEEQESLPQLEAQHTQPTVPSSAASDGRKKNVRGSYRSIKVDMKTKNGGKIPVTISNDVGKPVGDETRDFVNHCGYVVRTTASLRDSKWKDVSRKHGETMWLKVKDKFIPAGGKREVDFHVYTLKVLQKAFRNWKNRTHTHYNKFETDEDRLANPPDDVDPDDWEWLVSDYFTSDAFKTKSETNKANRKMLTTQHGCGSQSFAEVEESTRDPDTQELAPLDHVWKLQHTRKNKEGEAVWTDPKSQEMHEKIQQVMARQSEQDEGEMSRTDMLIDALGEKSGYVRGRDFGVKPPRKRTISQVDLEHAIQTERAKMHEELTQEFQDQIEERLAAERDKMKEEMTQKFQEEIDQRISAQLALLIPGLQQGQSGSNATDNSIVKEKGRSQRQT